MPMVRTDSPSTLFLFFQNPMSFLKAKKSKTECSSETKKVRPRKMGLPSSRTLFSSSDSPSPMAPHDCCTRTHTQTVATNARAHRQLLYAHAHMENATQACRHRQLLHMYVHTDSCRGDYAVQAVGAAVTFPGGLLPAQQLLLVRWHRVDAQCYKTKICRNPHQQQKADLLPEQLWLL